MLVTEIDGKAVPKVIDFGIAKALNQDLTQRTLYTSFQSLVGTPLYMSPEQARLSGVDVSVVEGGAGRFRFDQGSREELGNILETRRKVGCLRRVFPVAPLTPVAPDEQCSGQRTQQPFEAGA